VVYDSADGRLRPHDASVPVAALAVPARPTAQRLTVRTVTPLRLKRDGKFQRDFTFRDLVRAVLERIDLLARLYGRAAPDLDFEGLLDAAEAVPTERAARRWQEQARYSCRQGERLLMGGSVGWATFAGELTPFLPLLTVGEVIHVGQGTVMGLGKYRLEYPVTSDE